MRLVARLRHTIFIIAGIMNCLVLVNPGCGQKLQSTNQSTTVPAHLDYFPSRLHAAVYRNWETVPIDRLANVLETSVPAVLEIGKSLGLPEPPVLSPEMIGRNRETVLRRNWPIMPRTQIEALLGWSGEQMDHFLSADIAFRVLLGAPPPDLTPVTYAVPDEEVTARARWFASQILKHKEAIAGIDEEARFGFISELSQKFNLADHVPGSTPRSGDADLRSGWTIRLPEEVSSVTRTYVDDFARYCEEVHKSDGPGVTDVTEPLSSNTLELRIHPQTGRDEAYSLQIAEDSIQIVGATDRAVARGLIELERRMAERGGAFLAPTSGTLFMSPSFSPRYVYPYFAPQVDVLGQSEIDPVPDGYLSKVARQDADGIWLFCVLEDLVDSPVFEGMGKGGPARLERLRRIVERAAKYGLKVYLYFNEPRAQPHTFYERYPAVKGRNEGPLAAMCTSTDDVRRHVKGSFAKLFREVPGLGGTFIITASENLTHCYAHGTNIDCERCKNRSPEDVIAELVRATADGVHKSAPDAKVIVWDWSWHSVGIKDPQQKIVDALQPDCALMADFERGTAVNRGGVPMTVDEYSISVVGPSPRAEVRSQQARKLDIPFLAKIQLSTTWECGTVPFIPVPGLLAAKAEAMTSVGVTGCMQSWTLGSCPSPNTEAFAIKQWNPQLSVEETLARVAQRRYGDSATTRAVSGWMQFGKVFSEMYPYSVAIYTGPIQYAPGLPWYRNQIPPPYGNGAMLNPKGDWKIWTQPYSAEQMATQLRLMCEKWAEALQEFEEVIKLAAPTRKQTAERDYGVAWLVDYTFRSFANALDFYRAREGGDVGEMKRIAKIELASTTEAYRYILKDSRLGWEAQLQYYYTPSDVLHSLIPPLAMRLMLRLLSLTRPRPPPCKKTRP